MRNREIRRGPSRSGEPRRMERAKEKGCGLEKVKQRDWVKRG